jgi:NADH:ubiquinone oxidoreductase subunit 3 (subunit A)
MFKINIDSINWIPYNYDYIGISVIIFVSILLSFILLILSYLVSPKNAYAEKLSAYECGFEPFDEARKTFDIHFYIVAILFIIFDLEVAFLFPWVVALNKIGFFGYWVMVDFLFTLILGFIYVWKRGALDWTLNFKN